MLKNIPSPYEGEGKGEVAMKTYIIKKTDIMLNGKLIPEGSTIELSDDDAKSLSEYLIESKDASLVTNNSSQKHKRSK